MKVLVVDDDEAIRTYLTEQLTPKGHEVVGAGSGEEAAALIEAESFNLILLDVRMPVMGGMEVLKRINHLGVLTPVIVMTGFGGMEVVQEAMRLGAFDYLRKPFNIKEFYEITEKAMVLSVAIETLSDALFKLDDLGVQAPEKKFAFERILNSMESFHDSKLEV